MLAAYPIIQASNYVIYEDLLLPGIYDPEIVLLLKDKANNKDPVGFTGLIAAVLKQARLDAMAGDQEAIEWLAGDLCFDMCFALRFNHNNVIAWLEKESVKQ